MKLHRAIPFLVLVLVFSVFVSQVYAREVRFPPSKTVYLLQDRTYYFGDVWVNSSGTDLTVQEWFVNGWVNYTCTAGNQKINNGTKPDAVYFDNVEQTEDTTWNYYSGTVNVTTSSTLVSIVWGEGEAPDPPVIPSPSFPIYDLDTLLMQYLLAGDYAGFIIACYTTRIGQGFYGLLLFAVFGILYLRTRSIALCAILWLLLGSMFIATTWIMSPIAVILVVLGLTGILYSLFTRSSE